MKEYTAEKVDALFRAKLKLGLQLLCCFVVVYALFVAAHILSPDWLASSCLGINLGLVLGISLIVSIPVMAIIFHVLSCRIEQTFVTQLQRAAVVEK